jgi:hypothetical protein
VNPSKQVNKEKKKPTGIQVRFRHVAAILFLCLGQGSHGFGLFSV